MSDCPLCGKEKIDKVERTCWLHSKCFIKLHMFLEEKYGISPSLWNDTTKAKYLKEFLSECKEKVEFT